MTRTMDGLVESVGELVSLPEVAVRVNRMVEDPDSSVNDMARLISRDPALTARLLRIANSPYYGFAAEIETVARAIAVLGARQVRDLALATSAADAFAGMSNRLVSMENFWYHSVFCALAAQHLAGATPERVQGDVMFVAGLLHDIGELVIFHQLPDEARDALLLSVEGPAEPDLYLAEREIIGFDHSQLGGRLARHWSLPVVLAECIEFHHEPQKAEVYPVECALVHIANSIAYLAEVHSEDLDDAPAIQPLAWERTGLTPAVVQPAIAAAWEQAAEVQATFFPGQEARRA